MPVHETLPSQDIPEKVGLEDKDRFIDCLVLNITACLRISTEVVCFPRNFMESTKSKGTSHFRF